MRSVVVVLPASMWAMMPMFLHRSNGTVLDTAFFLSSFCDSCFRSSCSFVTEPVKSQSSIGQKLPAIVRKGLVGFRHAMNVFLFLYGCAAVVASIEQFVAQFVDHALLGASAGVNNEPADRQRRTPVRIHFDRNLIVGATDTTTIHFKQRLGVLHRLLEQLEGLVSAFFLQARQRLVKDAFRSALLALPHHGVNEFRDQIRPVHRIRLHFPLGDISFSRHLSFWLLASSCQLSAVSSQPNFFDLVLQTLVIPNRFGGEESALCRR